jgi:phage tail protein X
MTNRFWSRFARTTLLVGSAVLSCLPNAQAFTHVGQAGDTLANLAERYYGKVQNERLLVAANGLDVGSGIRIAPGMRIEIPALMTVRVEEGQTWKELAIRYLGAEARAFAIAQANDSQPWLLPEVGAEVVIPYNLHVVARGDDTIVGLAYRYLGDRKAAWMLDQYNERKGKAVTGGDMVLLPLVDIQLTESGRLAAAAAANRVRFEARGTAREAQQFAATTLPQLTQLTRHGQYIEALRLGLELLTIESLSPRQEAHVQRVLLECYAALGAEGRAAEACGKWLSLEPKVKLDPNKYSPKLIAACQAAKPAPGKAKTPPKPVAPVQPTAPAGTAKP